MRLCLISMDAVARPDADRLFRLPALSALREESAFCPNVQTVYPTVTYPIHASILTGCYPDRTGIGHNKPFQPDTPHDLQAWYWDYRAIREGRCCTPPGKKGWILPPSSGLSPGNAR